MSRPISGTRFPDRGTERLFRHAVTGQWDLGQLRWRELELSRVARPVRAAMGTVYGDILFGEVSGFALAGRLMERLPSGWARDLASYQVADEARHVALFTEVLTRLGADSQPTDALQGLSREVLAAPDEAQLMLGALIVETTAHVIFVEGAKHDLRLSQRALQLPGSAEVRALLDIVLRYVGRDEARHVAFAAKYLEHEYAVSARGRAQLERIAGPWCRLLWSHYAKRSAAYGRLGFQTPQLLSRLWQAQRQQLRRLGVEIGEAPELPREGA